jgi:xylulokinase
MQLMDVPKRGWSDEVLGKLELDKALFGKVYESPEVTGTVHKAASEATGLAVGTPVVGGAGDQAAGAVGNGIVRPGVVSSTIGTSGVVFAHSKDVTIDPAGRVHTLCHAVPGAWHIMGATQGAGLSLKWFRDQFCAAEKQTAESMGVDPYVLMDAEAEAVPIGSNGLLYLPYLMGERTPHLDPHARGVFFGLSAKHERRDLLRAVMEGVVFSLRDCVEGIRDLGIEVSEVRASGGGGRSALWRQMQADVFATDIATVSSTEGSALGVALLAGVGAGIWKSVPEACDATITVKTRQKSDAAAHTRYEPYYGLYRDLYPSLKKDFKRLSEINGG